MAAVRLCEFGLLWRRETRLRGRVQPAAAPAAAAAARQLAIGQRRRPRVLHLRAK